MSKSGEQETQKINKPQLSKEQLKEAEDAKEIFAGVLSSYTMKRARIYELENELKVLRAEVELQEEQFEFLKKIDKRIAEVGRNVLGIGEGVKKVKDEKPARKRKRESLEKEAKRVKRLMKKVMENDDKE